MTQKCSIAEKPVETLVQKTWREQKPTLYEEAILRKCQALNLQIYWKINSSATIFIAFLVAGLVYFQ